MQRKPQLVDRIFVASASRGESMAEIRGDTDHGGK